MKKLNAFLVSALATAALNAAVIEQVIVRQQWPWSTDVKVEYKLSGVTKPVDLTVKAYNGDVELPLPTTAVKGERYGISEDGVGTIVIDPVMAFGNAKVALANFKVKLTVSDSPENLDEVIYKILTLNQSSSVPCENVTRRDILNGKYGSYETDYSKIGSGFQTSIKDVLIWTGVTNDIAYKTTKLVLRKIPAAGKNFKMGSGTDASQQSTVSFANDYWMAVFETTAYQHRLMYQSWIDPNYSYLPWESQRTQEVASGVTASDVTPADYLSWSGIRAHKGDDQWPVSTHADSYEWYQIGRLRVVSGELYDLPTSAEWEFAARAGTTTELISGKTYSESGVAEICRTWAVNCKVAAQEPGSESNPDRDAGFPTAACSLEFGCNMVGQYRPNAYGLYDMMGNAVEWCLDYRNQNVPLTETYDGKADPKGPSDPTWSTSPDRVLRGGSYRFGITDVGQVYQLYYGSRYKDAGYRLCLHEVNK